MKISKAPIGSTVKCCGNTAVILKHGSMGTRINVLKSEFDNTILGNQIWSNDTPVEYTNNAQATPLTELLPQSEGKVPLNLF